MADKKPAPATAAGPGGATKANSKMLIIGGALMALGLAWGVYELNPGGMLREETKEEIKARKDAENLAKEKERDAARRKRR